MIESVIAGTADPDRIRRPSIAAIIRRAPALRAKLEAARSDEGEQTQFAIETDRVRRVLVKLARGHAAYELSRVCRDEPSAVWWSPLALMTAEQLDEFDASQVVGQVAGWGGEIGSRGFQRLVATQFHLESRSGDKQTLNVVLNDWVEVQEERYRYLAIDEGGVRIKMVIGEYLACEVAWASE